MASNSKDIRAGAAYVEMYIRDNLTKPLNDMGKKLQQWGANVASAGAKIFAAGAAATGVMLAAVRHFAESGAQLARVSQQIGVSVESLSELRYAAQQAGLSFEDLQALFKGTDNFLQQIRSGSAEAYQALGQLGISVTELQGKSPDQVMERIADGLARIPDPTLRASRAMQIFGEAGLKALPMFAQGAAGIQRMRQEARALGLQVSTRDANAALALSQAWARVWATIQAAVFAIGGALEPVLKVTLDTIQGFVTGTVQWIQQNRGLVQTVFAVTVGVATAGAALVALGVTMVAVGAAMSGIALAVSAILSPVGLVVIAVGSLAYAFRSQLASALGPALNAVTTWAGHVRQSISNIVAFLSAGDIQNAWQVVATEMQNVWDTVTDYLQSTWDGVRDYLEDVWTSWTDFFQNQWDTAVNAVSAVWQAFTTRYAEEIEIAGNVWEGFCTEMQRQFEIAIGGILVALEVLQGAVQTATAGMSVLFGAGQSNGGSFINGLIGGSGAGGAIQEVAGFAGDVGNQFQGNQNNSQAARDAERQAREAAREQERSSREIGREFDQMVRDELLRMERERQRIEAEWTQALAPGTPAAELAAAGAGLQSSVRMAQPLGTFNAFAAGGMAPSDRMQRRIVEASETTAEQIERAVGFLQDMAEGLTYG